MKGTHRLLVAGGLGVIVALALAPPAAATLSEGSYHCILTGGNSIVVDFQLSQQGGGEFFALTGQWDDASNTPFLPIFGAVLTDPAFNIVGSFTRVGFRGVPLPGSPFGSLPAGIHVQFQLDEVPPGPRGADFAGRWADNLGNFGRMACTVTP